jgi:CRP/FNR family transcriptional regulator, anaerobic regulatory protein
VMKREDFIMLLPQNIEFERLGRFMAEQTFIAISQRLSSLLLQSPEERYVQLLRERPKVVQRVPQYMIASYLGITPEALSRIRRRLADR